MTKTFRRLLAALLALALAFTPAPVAFAANQGEVTVRFDVAETTTTDLGGTANWALKTSWPKAFSNGTGDNQANKVYQDSATLAGSGTLSIDLDSTLTSPTGQSISFSRIVGVCARRTNAYVASTQDENVTIGGDFILTKYLIPGGDTLSAVTIPIGPAGVWCHIFPGPTGVAVTATTGDVLLFTNASSADSTTLEVVIWGS